MVFARFLTGEARRPQPLTITINGSKVEPWDPSCLDQQVERLPAKELRVGNSLVRYRPFVLPPQRDFSDDESWRRASGPNQWNRQQGLYIYRADRMIVSGGWSRLRGIDEHVKLARAALEFWPELDEAFEINIAKMRVRIPEELRDQLRPMVAFLSRCADDRYRKSSRRASPRPAPASPGPTRKPGGIGTPDPTTAGVASETDHGDEGPQVARVDKHNLDEPQPHVDPSSDAASLLPRSRRAALERAAASANAADELERISTELLRTNPEVARDLGW